MTDEDAVVFIFLSFLKCHFILAVMLFCHRLIASSFSSAMSLFRTILVWCFAKYCYYSLVSYVNLRKMMLLKINCNYWVETFYRFNVWLNKLILIDREVRGANHVTLLFFHLSAVDSGNRSLFLRSCQVTHKVIMLVQRPWPMCYNELKILLFFA